MDGSTLDATIERILVSEAELQARIEELGNAISEHYRGRDLLLVSVLKGSVVFLADLMRHITTPHSIDFMATSSYGSQATSSGVVRILKDLDIPLADRNVLIVEDIIDSGRTLEYLMRLLRQRQPASIQIVTLLDKPERREVDIQVKWIGFSIPNEFVVGYGLDFDEKYRNLPYIGVLKGASTPVSQSRLISGAGAEALGGSLACLPVFSASAGQRRARRLMMLIAIAWLGLNLVLPPAVAAQEPTQPAAGSYTVQAGDTLYEIAVRFGTTVEALAAANGIANPNLIAPGMVLTLPSGNLPAVDTTPAITVPAIPGQSLSLLAQLYAVPVERVAAVNRLPETVRLFPGQPIRLPLAEITRPPTTFGALTLALEPDAVSQGRTGRLVVQTSRPLSLTVTWNGMPLVATKLETDPTGHDRYFTPIPAPALIAPGPYSLDLSYIAGNGALLTWSREVRVVDGGYDSQTIVVPQEKAGLLAPEVVQAENLLVQEVWSQVNPVLAWTGIFSRPISSEYATTSPFGTRRSYNGGTDFSSYHAGQDFGAPADVPVLAPAAGTVAMAQPLEVRGNVVILDHGGGIFTGYWHLNRIDVVAGQTVEPGQILGGVGTTGLSTGNHLHWEMRIFGIAVDPMQFLEEPLVR